MEWIGKGLLEPENLNLVWIVSDEGYNSKLHCVTAQAFTEQQLSSSGSFHISLENG